MTMKDVEYLLSKLESLLEETTLQRSEIQGLVDVIQGNFNNIIQHFHLILHLLSRVVFKYTVQS